MAGGTCVFAWGINSDFGEPERQVGSRNRLIAAPFKEAHALSRQHGPLLLVAALISIKLAIGLTLNLSGSDVPILAMLFVRREATEHLEPAGGIMGCREVCEVHPQLLVALVMEAC